MDFSYDIIIFSSIAVVSLSSILFIITKKRKRSAKSIYKLINELEKKYIY